MHTDKEFMEFIKNLTKKELMSLKNCIDRRLWDMNGEADHQKMAQYKIGDKVSFLNREQRVYGIIKKINKGSARIVSYEDDELWTIKPDLLQKDE